MKPFQNNSESRGVISELFTGYFTFTQHHLPIYQEGKSDKAPSRGNSLLRQ